MNVDYIVVLRVSMVLYGGLWAYLKIKPHRLLRRKTPPSVYEVEKISNLRFVVGWSCILFVNLIFILLSFFLLTLETIWEHICPI